MAAVNAISSRLSTGSASAARAITSEVALNWNSIIFQAHASSI